MKAWMLPEGDFDLNRDSSPLQLQDFEIEDLKETEILIKVLCCGMCHTELDEIEGRAKPPKYPIIPGHQVIGIVQKTGTGTTHLSIGDRVGVAWIYSSCGHCDHCLKGEENLCKEFCGTGKDAHGGYAEFMKIKEGFAYPVPESLSNEEAAPLLCAGAIGYRSLRLTHMQNGDTLGLTGFGASGHLVLKLAKYLYPNSKVFVFARSKDEQEFSLTLGASWAGNITDEPPSKVNAIIDTTPVWNTVVGSMNHLYAGGRLVINAIRKESADQSALMSLDYREHLWMEKEIKSVANITRKDVAEFLDLASKIPIKPEVEVYPFEKANAALVEMKRHPARGAKVLQVAPKT